MTPEHVAVKGRSFGNVEHKLFEMDFFLRKVAEATEPHETMFYLSAFASAGRSVTFALKASLSHMEGFQKWYEKHESTLKANPLSRYFVEARNESQKLGVYHIGGGSMHRNEKGKLVFKHFFAPVENKSDLTPQTDVYTACKQYFLLLLEIVYDCFQEFGPAIDPEQYYTVENMLKLGKKIEDFEEELGYPRGWTACIPDTERIRLLRKEAAKSDIDTLFNPYLKKDRFGRRRAAVP
jgi:hypothetical protein